MPMRVRVCLAAIDYTFRDLRVLSIAAVKDVSNIDSERMLLKTGFLLLGEADGLRYCLRTSIPSRERRRRRSEPNSAKRSFG